MSVATRAVREPVPLAECIADVAAVLALSDERDRQLEWRLQAWRDGWRAGHAAGWNDGYLAAIAEVKKTDRAIAGVFGAQAEVERSRWRLRGERRNRTRRTFAAPHKDDYPGRDGAA
jgi:hypothetical protein